MYRLRWLILLILVLCRTSEVRADAETVTNAAALARALSRDPLGHTPFDLKVSVSRPCSPSSGTLGVWDETGAAVLAHDKASCTGSLRAGDHIRVSGYIGCTTNGFSTTFITDIRLLAHGTPPPIATATAEDILSGRVDYRLIRTTGILSDVQTDDIDADNLFLTLNTGDRSVFVSIGLHWFDAGELSALLGRQITVSGLLTLSEMNWRRQTGRLLSAFDRRDIQAQDNDADRFAAPPLPESLSANPSDIARLGQRRVSGRVLAVWQHRNLLLKTESGRILRITLFDTTPPASGATVEVVGFPQTDLFSIGLANAAWRPANPGSETNVPPQKIELRRCLTDRKGRPRVNISLFGQSIRLTARLVALPLANDSRLLIEEDGCRLPVDASALPQLPDGLAVNALVELTGVFAIEAESWRSPSNLPHIRTPLLVLRTPADIRIVRSAPFWTATRLLFLIALLAIALVGVLIRLRVIRARAALKSQERTRLAVELHDSIAQMLTGVSMELESARDREGSDRQRHLDVAAKVLKSCRDGLKDCLWDLRNDALDDPSLSAAIRRTLQPHLGEARLAVRMIAPRKAFSDNAAHALLCIVRELVLNALRHGDAASVRVAGVLEDGILRVSVTDDGKGFDPDSAPGIVQGHFGLQGIRERLALLGGALSIVRHAHGMRAAFFLPVPRH